MIRNKRGSITVEAIVVSMLMIFFSLVIYSVGEALIIKSQAQSLLDKAAIMLSAPDEGITAENIDSKLEGYLETYLSYSTFKDINLDLSESTVEEGKLHLVLKYQYRKFDFMDMIPPINVKIESVTNIW